ncbi:MAG: ribonuclease P protein component [Bacilli bacterium]|jgi:ribonuclease P protein component
MKKINRVLKNEDFQLILDNGNYLKSTSFTVVYLKNDLDRVRVGIAVSKKLGKAVKRNKVKRQIRSMCQSVIDITAKVDIIIIPKNEYLNKTYKENLLILSELLSKLGATTKNETQK